MSQRDPAMFKSGYERRPGERYWTHPWMTDVLLRHVALPGVVWEPAVGRGDMANALAKSGRYVLESDIDISERPEALVHDFIGDDAEVMVDLYDVGAVVTNPPYGAMAGHFIRKALSTDVQIVAMLLRSEFKSAGSDKRRALFVDEPFSMEICLHTRPYWDWWLPEHDPSKKPRHNYSWFVWDRKHEGEPVIHFDRRPDETETET